MEFDFDFYEKIVDGWERTETDCGVPYFENHITETTSWDHPFWLKILEGLKDYDSVKYAAYRTALMIRHLQKQLHLHHIELCTIQQEFEDSGHVPGSYEVIGCNDLLTLLISIHQRSNGHTQRTEEIEMLADLTLNLLLNVFDKDKTGVLNVLSVKWVLVILSSASLTEKYRYLYQELHDPSTYISTHALSRFLQAIMKLPDFLHESVAFGRTCEPAVASCEQMGSASGGITEDVFYRWLHRAPQTIVWLPTLHRIAASETVSHDAKCSACKCYPVIGLRYKCLRCFNYNLCQMCFFLGKSSKRHTTKHPTQEYCNNSTTKDDAAAFMKTLKNNLSRKHRQKSRIKYLPIEADSQYTNLAWSPEKDDENRNIHQEITEAARKLADLETHGSSPCQVMANENHSPETDHAVQTDNSELLTPKDDGLQKEREELNAIILKLEEENRMLYEQLSALREVSDIESVTSDSDLHHSLQRSPNRSLVNRILRETEHLPIREPLPVETTPIFLGVPIINLNNYHISSESPSSALSQSPSTPQPDFSFSGSFSSPYCQRSPEGEVTPPQTRTSTLGASVDALDTSPARFSLPSPTKSYDEFNSEEAELRALVNEADQMFPADLSFGRPSSRTNLSDDEILQAADSIRFAMSEFVNKAVRIQVPH